MKNKQKTTAIRRKEGFKVRVKKDTKKKETVKDRNCGEIKRKETEVEVGRP